MKPSFILSDIKVVYFNESDTFRHQYIAFIETFIPTLRKSVLSRLNPTIFAALASKSLPFHHSSINNQRNYHKEFTIKGALLAES